MITTMRLSRIIYYDSTAIKLLEWKGDLRKYDSVICNGDLGCNARCLLVECAQKVSRVRKSILGDNSNVDDGAGVKKTSKVRLRVDVYAFLFGRI